ncbi:hypothetical protein JZ751_025811 [Albula glossodonta]|uniref:Fibronectin type-III domain-containing protein n=1 Tax=Albula glossodonta TaxID=121402 RepID=A0A8T2NPW4_9TELE|nr:hypothetical protein JZ751_025811 [Albula glossodonta]
MTARWTRFSGASSYKLTATPKFRPSEPAVFAHFSGNTVMGSVGPLSPDTDYTVEVEAMDATIIAIANAQAEGKTAPVRPMIEHSISKMSDSITVEFNSVSGATSYIVRAENNEFFSETEVSGSPATVFGLQPYTIYALSVMSVNSGGRSQPSLPVEERTVLPAPLLTTESPSNDTIVATWDPLDDAVQYTVVITQQDDPTNWEKFNTTSTSMNFMGLESGTYYCIKINAWDANSIAGDSDTKCQITRPKSPEAVRALLERGRSTGMGVSWHVVRGADSYFVLSSTGQNCTANETYCVISPLDCSQNHTITVTAENAAGPSSPSYPEDFLTFPCPPESLWAEEPVPGNCTLHWSEVTWAEYYGAFVKRDDGVEELCNTTGNECNFRCDCGFTYFMTVFAYNQAGSSRPGPIVNYTTIPCCPENVQISLVSTETLEIIWTPVRGAEVYQTKAAGNSDLILCNDTAPVCALSDLNCNTRYSVVVTPCSELRGCNHTCRPHTQETAPCSPEILSVTQNNETCITVTWSSSNREANYTVRLTSQSGPEKECQSTGTSCDIYSLPCGTTYDVTALATTPAGPSLPSYTVPLETAPCCPQNLTVRQVTQAMSHVTWSPAKGAQSYITSLTSTRGEAKCHTMDRQCLMGCITCGTNYTVSLEAISKTGHKSECTYHGFSSSACCPTHVRLYRMSNNTIRVQWRSSSSKGNFSVELFGANSNYTCTPATGRSSCDVSYMECGDVYSVVVAPVSLDGTRLEFCPLRMYSVIYRGKRSLG